MAAIQRNLPLRCQITYSLEDPSPNQHGRQAKRSIRFLTLFSKPLSLKQQQMFRKSSNFIKINVTNIQIYAA